MMLLERKNSSDGKGIVQRNTLQGKTWHTRESEKGRQYLSLAAYHAMTLILRVCVKNAVSRRVVSRRIHSIGTSLVERCLHCPVSSLHTRDDEACRTYRKPHILRLRACDSNHGAVVVWSQSGSSEGSLPARKFSITTGVSNGLSQRIKVEVQKATKILYHSKSGSKALYNLATHPQEHPRAPPTRCGNPTATISIRGEIRSAYYAPPIAAELVGPYTAAVEAVLAFCLPREGCPSTSPAKSRSVLSDEAPKASSGSEKLNLNAE
jgi:hypothetical protein